MTDASLLWPDDLPPRRGPKPRMTLEKVVEAAIAVADSEGLPAVSMQRVADQLGATKMSLYRYVPSKAELTSLMLDSALGFPPAAVRRASGWRDGLTLWTTAMHTCFTTHPWALELSVGARVLGPNELAWLEAALGCLTNAPLSAVERLDVLALLAGHARGVVQQQASGPAPERAVGELMSRVLATHAADYPHTAAAFVESADAAGRDEALAFGLDRILDGIAALVALREKPARRRGR
jgi:AcrR family transcriptional regulator